MRSQTSPGARTWWPAWTPAASCSGGAVAIKLGIGVLAVRKGGKLPPPVFSETYELEYGTATLEVPAEGIELAGRTIVIIDDVLATGGTLAATASCCATPARTSRVPRWCSSWPPWAAATCSNRCRSPACTRSEGYPRSLANSAGGR